MVIYTFWPNHENDNLELPNFSSHILCICTHTRLHNKITNIIETNKIHKTNSYKPRWHSTSSVSATRSSMITVSWRNNGIVLFISSVGLMV